MFPITVRTLVIVACAIAASAFALAAAGRSGSGDRQQSGPAKSPQKRLHGPGLHHIAVKVADFDRSMRFYEKGLGMKRAFGWGEGNGRACLVDMGDGNYIELFAGGKPRPAAMPEYPVLHFALRSGDPDADYKRAMEAGATSQMEPTDITIPGDHGLKVRIAFVVGPDGEVIEFFKNDEL